VPCLTLSSSSLCGTGNQCNIEAGDFIYVQETDFASQQMFLTINKSQESMTKEVNTIPCTIVTNIFLPSIQKPIDLKCKIIGNCTCMHKQKETEIHVHGAT